MYGKIFASMYDGSLCGHWQAIITLQQMIVLCDVDGVVDMTPQAISARTSIPIDIIKAGIEHLEQPDPYSRTKDLDGRRIEPLDDRGWGWCIVNYKKFRHLKDAVTIRDENAERQRRHRLSQTVTRSHAPSLQGEAEAEVKEEEKKSLPVTPPKPVPVVNIADAMSAPAPASESKKRNSVPYEQIVEMYHALLPELPKVAKLTNQRKGYIRQRWLEDLPDLDAWSKYFHIVRKSKFLMGLKPGSNGRPPFRADLTWLIRPENIAKVIEGKYHHG